MSARALVTNLDIIFIDGVHQAYRKTLKYDVVWTTQKTELVGFQLEVG